MKILIVAGGQGTKLWPYSRQDKPKQFQPIIGDVSAYQFAVETLLSEFAPEDIFVSTKQKFIKYVSEQSPQIPLKNYIVEPDIALDRGPAEGLAFLKLSLQFPEEPVFYVQGDMVREPGAKFIEMIQAAEKIVTERGCYITGGVKATEPNMGADYLELAEAVDGGKVEAYVISKFHYRKGTVRETRHLVENFRVALHWNHLCWYPAKIIEAYKQYRPDWYEALMKVKDVLDKPGEQEAVREIYETMAKGPTEDVTRHLMDSGEAVALLLPFRNTDVGTWESVREFSEDDDGNHFDANVVAIGTRGTLVKSQNEKKIIAVAGLKDIVVVDSEQALLVLPRDEIDKIKDIQKMLEERGETEYL
ncbi:MAG TPA: sugar phosphate nucleotidyltransferase [Candidatus Saccharimonadales bacterium]|nr:sugar phosphate nucleotidyltransferase [Candidatus Saccharimonadales bacterium]